MRARLFLFFLLCSFGASAQNYSVRIDSLTRQNTARFARGQQFWVDSILATRQSSEWLKRIDTMECDYAFIDELYDGEAWTEERYFLKEDTLPKSMFVDGEHAEIELFYSGLTESSRIKTLNPMLRDYAKMLPNQELDYEKTQYWVTGCLVYFDDEEQFRQRRKERLSSTYAIRTMVDKVNNRIVVSVQTAPQNPEFRVKRRSMGVSF
jgi:hypothetical protein